MTQDKRKQRKPRQQKPKAPSEQEKVTAWRKESFERIVRESGSKGVGSKTIDALVKSTGSPHDFSSLIQRGCPAKTAARIII